MWRKRELVSGPVRAILLDERGGVAVYAAIAMPLLLGSIGLGVDVGLAYSSRQAAQHQADAGAMAAALEIAKGKTTDEVEAAAQDDAEDNGWVEARGDTIAVESPPTAGDFAGDATAAEVEITRPVQLSFVRFVGADSDITVSARAVARLVRPEACVWSLEPIETGIEITGTAQVELNCGVYSRSTSGEAIDQNGTSCLTATSVVTAGGTTGSCINPTPRNGAAQIDDPLGALPVPSTATSCDWTNKKVNNDETLDPGVYCGGIQVTGNSIVTFNPGVYVIRGGEFSATGNSQLYGSEVTFYLTERNGDYATLDVEAAVMELSAPTSGANKGVLFFQDRNAPTTLLNKITGNADMQLNGIVYMPTTELAYRGGSSSTAPASFLVARKVSFTGNSYVSSGGSSIDLPSGLTTVSLVE
jgi:Putative Flp pilus-assembly TadE/G-like